MGRSMSGEQAANSMVKPAGTLNVLKTDDDVSNTLSAAHNRVDLSAINIVAIKTAIGFIRLSVN